VTTQILERLIFDGEEASIASCPRVPIHPRVRRSDLKTSLIWSTACKRGYQGTWEIRAGRFYLAGLVGRFELVGDDPLLAKWFTGVLRVPRGEVLRYRLMGFGSAVFEEEVHVKVERGVVVDTRAIDNRVKRHSPPLQSTTACPNCAYPIPPELENCPSCGARAEDDDGGRPDDVQRPLVGEITPGSDLPALRVGLLSPHPTVRHRCATSIGDLGGAGADALPDLEKLRRDPTSRVRQRATWAVQTIQDKLRKARK
jgi:hypothetical protein